MKINLFLATIALAILPSLVAAPAGADTIYMKNGRVITSSSVTVEGDYVYVRLLGGEVRFSLALVDRIVEDDAVEPPPTVVPVPEPDPNDPLGQGDPTRGDPNASSDPAGQGDPAAGADPDPDPAPEQTRDYWQNRLRPLRDQLRGVDGDLARLRGSNTAAVQPEINTVEARRRRLVAQIDFILVEARRLGVPPGWLR